MGTSRRGPGERHFDELAARGALWLRAVMVGLCGGFGLIGYQGGAVFVAAAVIAAYTVLSFTQLRLRAISPAGTLAVNVVLAAAVGLSQISLGAQPFSGWIVATAGVTSITCYFEWPDRPVFAHSLAGVIVLSYGAGCVLAGGGLPVLPAGRMVVQAMLGFFGLLMIHRVACLYDRLSAQLARRRAAAAAARAQQQADRAYLATLHDTASTTFLMVSTRASEDFDWLPAQASRDLAVLTTEWSPPKEMDLAELLATLADYPGLTVRTELHGPLPMPSEPALAVYHGVREALSNARGHAGDPNATMTAHEHDGRIEVRVADRGRGFDPASVPPHRRGLSESIVGRMAAAGGQADIHAVPGHGTEVTWRWSHG